MVNPKMMKVINKITEVKKVEVESVHNNNIITNNRTTCVGDNSDSSGWMMSDGGRRSGRRRISGLRRSDCGRRSISDSGCRRMSFIETA